MGWIIKIALLGLAIYAAYKTFSRWKGYWDRFVGKPDEPPRPPAPPQPPPAQPEPKRIAEDVQACGVCGAFIAAGATRCGQANCPLPSA
jgi:hypothetical protein